MSVNDVSASSCVSSPVKSTSFIHYMNTKSNPDPNSNPNPNINSLFLDLLCLLAI